MADISTFFQRTYAPEVKLAFQREGSLLRNTCRTRANVVGSTAYFRWMGKGTATSKARNGKVVPMNVNHATPYATLTDKYAPEYVDDLDLLKTDADERQALAKTSAFALGRWADSQIITALAGVTTNDTGTNADGLTLDKAVKAIDIGLHENDVPDDGRITVLVGWKQWSELSQLDQFISADYAQDSWLRGAQAKRWKNALWMPHSGLPTTTDTRYCFAFHFDAVGHAIGQDIKTAVDWIAENVGWLVNSWASMGACVIDSEGVTRIVCKETGVT